ncbi:hypothetical protein ACNOYE_03825 [Nannocystaceae bacterium ST9]
MAKTHKEPTSIAEMLFEPLGNDDRPRHIEELADLLQAIDARKGEPSLLFDLVRLHARTHQELLRIIRSHGKQSSREQLAAKGLVARPQIIELEARKNVEQRCVATFVLENLGSQQVRFGRGELHGPTQAQPKHVEMTYKLQGKTITVEENRPWSAPVEFSPSSWAPCEIGFDHPAAGQPGSWFIRAMIATRPQIELRIQFEN